MITQNADDQSAHERGKNLFAFHSDIHTFFLGVVRIVHRAPRDKFDIANNNKGKQVHEHKRVVNTFLVNPKSGIFIYGDLLEQRDEGSKVCAANKANDKAEKNSQERGQRGTIRICDLVGHQKEYDPRSHQKNSTKQEDKKPDFPIKFLLNHSRYLLSF
jgi:hypothetical protein